MIITQKYNSAEDIDPEFIPSLEALLENCIPSFDLIKSYEKAASENIHFAYYLFFGNTTNAPIGFAQIQIEKNKVEKKSFFGKFLKENKLDPKNDKHLKWSIPGSLKEGIVFDPRFIKHACNKANKIFNDYLERKDIHTQELVYSQAYEELGFEQGKQKGQNKQLTTLDVFIKNKNSYEDFMSDLPFDIQKLIKTSWRMIQADLKLKMGEYSSFKDIFSYKKQGAAQYKNLKTKPIFLKYLNMESNIEFLTLESDQEVETIVAFTKGSGNHAFYEVLYISDHVPEFIAHQMAMLKFFERENLDKLHTLGQIQNQSHLMDLGFTQRNQYLISIKKD